MIARFRPLASCVAALWSLIPGEALAQGCAMCKTAVSSPDDPLARGLNWSILFLLLMPFAIVGSIGGWLFYAHRRAAGRRTKSPTLPQ